MPKKTKKEKIIAAYRRELRMLKDNSNPAAEKRTQSEVQPDEKPAREEIKTAKAELTDEEKNTTVYFFKDFRKSLILIFIVIALEIGLYFARIIK